MYWINGELKEALPASDRALHYGDGFFTTARIVNGQIQLLSYHLDRLQQAAERLCFAPLNRELLAGEMQMAANSCADGVLKLLISRGSGGRGYSRAGCGPILRLMLTTRAPAHYDLWRQRGAWLVPSPVALGCNPALAGIKHLNRLEQVLIRHHLDQTEADEALVLDSRGFLVECCSANLFWRQGTQVYTPSLAQAGVRGVMRRHILALLAHSPFGVQHVEARPAVLEQADEVLMCNALMPVVPVRRIGERCYPVAGDLFTYLSPKS